MPRKVAALIPSTEELLRKLGERLRLARLRRGLSAKQVAARAGMAPMTLRSLERGGAGVTIGAYVAVMQVLGMEADLNLVGQADPMGRSLQDAQLPRLAVARGRQDAQGSLNSTKQNSGVRVTPPTSMRSSEPLLQQELARTIRALPTEHLRNALDALPDEQIRQALSALPSDDLRRLAEASATAFQVHSTHQALSKSGRSIEKLSQDRLRAVIDSLPSEQLHETLKTLSGQQIQTALAALSSSQVRRVVEEQTRAFETLRKPIQDAQRWITQSGFVSSKALATLIDVDEANNEPKTKKR